MSSFTPSGVEFVARNLTGYLSDLSKADKAQQNLGRSAQGLSGQFSGPVSVIRNLGSTASSVGSGLVGLGDSLLGLGAKAAQIAVGGVAILGSALIAIGVNGTKAFIELEQGFANLEAISGDTKAQLEPLKGLISELALDPNLKVTANEATEALYALTKQGLSVEEIMGGAGRATVELSNATGAQFTPAATIAAGVMKAWSIDASNLSTVADGMTGVLTNSKFSVDDYNLAFSQSGAIFSNLGGSLTDFNTVIAGTSSAFSGGSDAGTSFKNLILTMSAPTAEAKAAMDQYGISIFNADGTMKNWSEVAGQLNKVLYGTVEVTSTVGGATKEQAAAAEKASSSIGDLTRDLDLQKRTLKDMQDEYNLQLSYYDAASPKMKDNARAIEKLTNNITDQEEKLSGYQSAINAVSGAQETQITSTKTLTEAERAKLAETIAGRDSSRLLLELGKMTSEQYDELSGKINKNGQAMNAASIRMDTASGALDILRGIIEAIQLQIGEKFTPMVKAAAKATSLWASENSGTIIAFFGSIATGIEGVITGLGKAAGAFSRFGIRGAAISILGQLGFTPEAISSVTSTIDTILTEVGRIQTAFAQFGLSGAAFSIGGLLGLDSDSMIAIQETVTGIIATVTGFATQVQALFAGMGIEEFKGALLGIGAVLATGVFAALVAGVLSLLTPFTLITGAVILFSTAWAGNWGGIQEIAATALAIITEAFNQFVILWSTNWPIIQAVALTAWEVLQGIFAGFQAALGPVIEQLIVQFSEIGVSLAGLGINWQTVWDAIVTATGIVAAGIGAAIVLIIGVVAGLATGIAAGISSAIGTFTALWTHVNTIFEGMGMIFAGWINTFTALINGEWAAAWEGFKMVMQGAFTMWEGFMSSLLTVAVGAFGVVLSTVGGFVDGIVGFFQGMYNSLIGNSIIPDLVNGIVEWFRGLPQKIVSALSNLASAISAPFKKTLEEAKNMVGEWEALGADFMAGLLEGLTKNGASVLEFLKGLVKNSLDQFGLGWAVQSPSKKTAEFGRNFIEGLIVGADDMAPDFQDRMKSIAEMAVEGMAEGIEAATPDVADRMRDLAQAATTTLSGQLLISSPSVVFDRLGQAIPQGLAAGITNAAGMATQAISAMGQSLITSTSNTSRFIDDLNMGGFAADSLLSNWNDVRDILHQNIGANMGGLASGAIGGADITRIIGGQAVAWNVPPGMLQDIAQAQGLVDHFSESFLAFQKQMRLENLANMVQMGGSSSSLGGTFAGMLEEQMGNSEAAKKAVEAYRAAVDKVITTEGTNRVALDKKELAIEKATEALDFGQRQMDIYAQELATLKLDEEGNALQIEKKVLQMDRLTESMDAQRKTLVTLQEELVKLTGDMEKNQAAVAKAEASYKALQAQAAVGLSNLPGTVADDIASIEVLRDFLAGTGETFTWQVDENSASWTWDRVRAQEELNRLLAEQTERERLITQQKEAQQKLDFLKSQLDLINLGRQLGGDIFAGITFGLDASVEDLLAATNAVTMAMVDQINQDLQIASPSKVMARIGERITQGLAVGVDRGGRLLEYAFNTSVSPFLDMGRRVASPLASTYNNSTNNYFDMKVSTGANPAAVIRQYEVARSMV